ncbi:hypothetical protein L596_027413 [Steinernema carpocapsae]|uniref:Snake toxin/toxin-like domain-containing protein n=1 Tax=Steinernema carpocapsae TaxID=34508 RepID=A0A4U5M5L7_STECR|nr:hypothetical protein L596_027413 [Steinernema carpocapsae]
MRLGLFACAFMAILCVTSALKCYVGGKGTKQDGKLVDGKEMETCKAGDNFCLYVSGKTNLGTGTFFSCSGGICDKNENMKTDQASGTCCSTDLCNVDPSGSDGSGEKGNQAETNSAERNVVAFSLLSVAAIVHLAFLLL